MVKYYSCLYVQIKNMFSICSWWSRVKPSTRRTSSRSTTFPRWRLSDLKVSWFFVDLSFRYPFTSCQKLQNNRDSAWRAITKFDWQLGRYEPSSPATKELHYRDLKMFADTSTRSLDGPSSWRARWQGASTSSPSGRGVRSQISRPRARWARFASVTR